jgi:hypothetical protein
MQNNSLARQQNVVPSGKFMTKEEILGSNLQR